MRRNAGFSVLELTIAMGLMLTVTATVFALLNPAQGQFAVEPEVADMQQRLRVGSDSLYKDLVMAGGGAYTGSVSGSLMFRFPSVTPYRQGLLNPDPPGTFKADTITIIYVPATKSQTSISDPMPNVSAELKVTTEAGCPFDSNGQYENLCGFADGESVMIYDDSGAYDIFTVTQVQGAASHLQHNLNDLSKAYQPGAKVVKLSSHTYYLKADDTAQTYQLMHYDGTGNPDVPVVDNVVGLAFEYYGEAQPPLRTPKQLSDSTGPWTTYGPKPPMPNEQPTAYPMGENCTFSMTAGNLQPRLADLSSFANPTGLVQLTQAQLTDGPWCPDAVNPNRWDADLLRVRKVNVTLRVQAALAALRGPAGTLFTHAGTSRSGMKYAPDQEIRFQVTPRNLNVGR